MPTNHSVHVFYVFLACIGVCICLRFLFFSVTKKRKKKQVSWRLTNKDIANKDMTQAKYHAFSSHHSKWSDDSSRRVGHWRPCGWLQRAQSLRPKLYVVPTDPASNLSIRISVIADLPRSVSTNCKLTTNWKTAFSLSSLLQCLRVAPWSSSPFLNRFWKLFSSSARQLQTGQNIMKMSTFVWENVSFAPTCRQLMVCKWERTRVS